MRRAGVPGGHGDLRRANTDYRLARLGSKIEARRLMQAAGVPTVPGETPADQTDAGLAALIRTIVGHRD